MQDRPAVVRSPCRTKYARKSAYSVDSHVIHTGSGIDHLIKTLATFKCQFQEVGMLVSERRAGRLELIEFDARPSGHIQTVSGTAFLQEHFNIPVAVDQCLGSIG